MLMYDFYTVRTVRKIAFMKKRKVQRRKESGKRGRNKGKKMGR